MASPPRILSSAQFLSLRRKKGTRSRVLEPAQSLTSIDTEDTFSVERLIRSPELNSSFKVPEPPEECLEPRRCVLDIPTDSEIGDGEHKTTSMVSNKSVKHEHKRSSVDTKSTASLQSGHKGEEDGTQTDPAVSVFIKESEIEDCNDTSFKTIRQFYLDKHFPRFELKSFTIGRIPKETLHSRAIIIHGPPNTGKTAFAISHFLSPIIITRLEELKDVNWENHDGIIIDEPFLEHLTVHDFIHLFDLKLDRTLLLGHGVLIKIPARIPRIITTYEESGTIGNFGNPQQMKLIQSKIKYIKITKKVYTPAEDSNILGNDGAEKSDSD